MENIKVYKPLVIPNTTAWESKSWKRYSPIWFDRFLEGINNIIVWMPIIFKDKNWDDYYILEILKFKLIRQRKHLIEHNRHMGIWQVNRDMTIAINLIQRIQDDSYACEYQDYCKQEMVTSPSDKEGWLKLDILTTKQNFEPYFKKYKNTFTRVKRGEYMKRKPDCDEAVALWVGALNQERCNKLLFKIFAERQNHWWD